MTLRAGAISGVRSGAILLAAACVGCSLLPGSSPTPRVYVPETVGVVSKRELVGRDVRYLLEDGRLVVIPPDGNYIGGSQPQEGELLMTGSVPEGWVARAAFQAAEPDRIPDDCYVMFGRATANSSHVFQPVSDARGDVIIVFPKSVGWTDEGYRDGSDMLLGVTTCINARGQATWHGF